MNHVISIENVSKKFGRQTVLDDVSFQVPRGVVFALLGENGAGKTTLIRGMLGYHKFKKGRVQVAGFDPVKQALMLRRTIGYVSDTPSLYEWMTVVKAGWFAASFYSDSEGFLQNYSRLVADFELPEAARIRDLSKGMRAKVALALAMAFDPQLLILDEPTSGLDPLVRRSFLESMIDRAASGQTVFLSSHQIHEVERVADWIAILHQGKLQVVAPLEDLKCDYRTLSFAMHDPLLALPPELDELHMISRIREGRTMECLVRDCTDEIVKRLEQHSNLFEVKVMRPNLEELYVGFTRPCESFSQTDGTCESDSQPDVA